MRLDLYQNGPHRLTSPLRRRPDGSYEEIDWDTAVSEIAAGFLRIRDEHGGASIFYYGGGGQGNHLGGAYSGAFLKSLGAKYRSSALAQEKTGEAWVDAQLYGGHTRGEFEHAEVSVFVGKNPWMSQSFPRARVVLREIAKDPERSMIVIDPVRHGHGQARRLPPARAARERRLVPGRAGGDARPGGPHRRRVPGRARERRRAGAGRAARGADRRLRRPLRSRRGPDPRGRAPHRRPPRASRCSRTSASSRRPTARCRSYLNKLLWILTGNFAKPGGQHLHSWMAPLFRPGHAGPHARHRGARDRRADAVQRHPRRDPHRPPRSLPRDDRREQQPGPLAGRLAALP